MTVAEVRQKFLDFMKDRGHVVLPGASLIPENDPTTLFTGSGMQPMIPYLLGETHPQGTRITNSQRSFRTEDIEEVGDNRHTTYFEMLGNWSFGDYFRQEQIIWISEFLFDQIGINPQKFYVTVFQGDAKNNLPRDTESTELWRKLFVAKGIDAKIVELGSEQEASENGMQGGRIFYYNAKKNWWSRAGVPDQMPVGEPGGPDTEMFYEFSDIIHDPKYGKLCHLNCDCGRYMEIGNNVFMTHKKTSEGEFELLPKRNVDFGGGLERMTSAANDEMDIFKLDIFEPFLHRLEKISGLGSAEVKPPQRRSFRIVMDHVRAAHALVEDGVRPSNTEQGYVLRRLIRRAVVHADKLGVPSGNLFEDEVSNVEEAKFRIGLKSALGTLDIKLGFIISSGKQKILDALDVYDLVTTHGLPLELIKEIATEKGCSIDEGGFNKKMEEHRILSRAGSEQKFKGGLADTSDMSVKYHTATHLLQQALRTVLGIHVFQKGSNITPERLRFDFLHTQKMTGDEKKTVEDIVNEQIKLALPITYSDISLEKAQKMGAIGLFEGKYGDKVRVYKVGDFSLEFCGGPHVTNTLELGQRLLGDQVTKLRFVIKKEEAVSNGVRRIKAVLQ
ncbi:MAG TPA: alanine--tRNA ligase-related protein [Candidatus Paceibacterota bacterium]